MIARDVYSIYGSGARENFREHLERGSRECGREIFQLEPEAHVGLVDAETFHRLRVRNPRERRLHVNVEHVAIDRRDHSLRDRLDILGPRARHLDIDLAEFGLAIRAQILVAETPGYLIIAIESADHQNLL